jgi:regulator of cell morphogenesis and NO signaling
MTPFGIRKRARAMLHKGVDLAREVRVFAVTLTSPTATTPATPIAAAPPAKKERNWELRSPAELVDHIVSHHHEGLRRDLPALVDVAKRLEREQAEHPAVPRGLADTLATMSAELEGHMLSEETSLFPELRAGARRGPVELQIRMMARDHEDHAKHLALIRKQTANLTAPVDASAEWAKLYADLVALEADLRQHIYLEDNILFARAVGG